MRVVVAADQLGALSSVRAGSALATAWADVAGAQCAVVPMGSAGSTFLSALAEAEATEVQLLPTDVDDPLATGLGGGDVVGVAVEPEPAPAGIPEGSSLPLGLAIAHALEAWPRPRTLVVDLTWAGATHDAGAGLLAALGARGDTSLVDGWRPLAGLTRLDLDEVRARLAGTELVGVVPAADVDQRLLGLRGLSAARGHRAQLDLADTMAADTALERFATLLDPSVAGEAGVGGCGGAALAVRALGGRLATGPEYLAQQVGLAGTVRRSDLVVTACDSFDYLTRGGDVVTHLAELAGAAGVPLVVVADDVEIGNREMRTFGVEAAHAVELGDPTEADLARAAAVIARTWRW